MKILIFVLLCLPQAYAKTVSEPMTVVKMALTEDKQFYRLTMLKHAAAYRAPKSFQLCLRQSLESQKDVVLSFDTKTLQISDCKTKP